MKTVKFSILLVLTMVVLLAICVYIQNKQKNGKIKWEYTRTDEWVEANKLGSEGWELVSVSEQKGVMANTTYIIPQFWFKRRLD